MVVIVTLILTLPIVLAHMQGNGGDRNPNLHGGQWPNPVPFDEVDNPFLVGLKKVQHGHGADANRIKNQPDLLDKRPPHDNRAKLPREVPVTPPAQHDAREVPHGLRRKALPATKDENTKPQFLAKEGVRQKHANVPIQGESPNRDLKPVHIAPKARILNPRYPESDKAVLDNLEVLYVSAPVATLRFPDSKQETDILMDTGSHTTLVLSPNMCKRAKCIDKPFACKYTKGEANGTMYKAQLGLGVLKWTQSIGSACSVKDLNKGIMGLSFGRIADPENEMVLMSWNVPYRAFGFLPQPHFRYEAERTADEMERHVNTVFTNDRKRGWMYAGKRLDVSMCSGQIARFAIEPQNKHKPGLWYTPKVRLVVNGAPTGEYFHVIWDTGSTLTRMRLKHAQLLPTKGKYLLELQGTEGKIGSVYSADSPFGTTTHVVQQDKKYAVIGMNFLSQFLIHFEYGSKRELAICKPNRNLIYSK